MKPAVIALCGPPGAGKSTLMRTLTALRPAYRTVQYDDFPNQTSHDIRDIKAWFERSGDPNEFDATELVKHLETLISQDQTAPTHQVILFETHFGRMHRQTGRFIDFLVWIDIPLEIALARQLTFNCRQHRIKPKQADAAFITWLEGFLQSYTDVVSTMYRRQAIDVRASADLVIDGLQPPADLAQSVLGVIEELGSARRG